MSYSKAIYERINDGFKKTGWKYSFDEEKSAFRSGFNIDSKLKDVKLRIVPRDASYTVFAYVNIGADENCRSKVAEYIARANYGLVFGNFELDMNDGEVRYKMTVDCGENAKSLPTDDMFERSIIIPVQMCEKYGDGLLAVMYGFMSPEQACADAEK